MEAIELSDLRLGNRINGGEVIGITNTHVTVAGHYNMSGFTTFDEESLRPEPLTEDWLEKFGFEKQDWHSDEYSPVFARKHLEFYMNDGFYEPKPYYFADGFAYGFKLKYVHQLQNLYFALTGEELKLKQ